MESQTEQEEARKPYEPPAVRELGKVAEITHGINALPGSDNTVASV